MGTTFEQPTKGTKEVKLDERNSFGRNGILIANTPVDGVLTVQFTGKAAFVDIPKNSEEALKAEEEGRERVNTLINKIDNLPTADEMKTLLSKLGKQF